MQDGSTRRVREERELVRSIRLSPIASIVTDPKAPDNPIIAANCSFEQLTGYTEAELLGRNCRILAGPETSRAQSASLSRAVASGTPAVVELVNYRKDGSAFLNAVMVAPLFDEEGNLAYFVGSQMEVSGTQPGEARAMAVERISGLTNQQRAVLRLMAQGMRNRQIGEALGLAEKTIKMHRGALVKRLGVSTAAEAMRVAIEAGL
ncbi:response regulator transcription factor [Sphingomonas sp. IC4-52]|uniref:response regulator transcription factor n=1 Tax=Sphingomonas sp. IC4-52 TaxID=2887202 RepID=UPI001D12E787|nr:PAS domain-containing protein [Sphingomonas sp. IC4-52]MCC2981187.1 PAS domain-containing protein [Sphingomonas sp. IC4-52]